MNKIVLDASIFAAYLLNQNSSTYVIAILNLLKQDKILALLPALFYDEVLNAILKVYYRKEIDLKVYEKLINSCLLFKPFFQDFGLSTYQPDIYRREALARKHNLRSYDAIYLDLALTQHCKLATLDQRLSRAAQIENCFFQA